MTLWWAKVFDAVVMIVFSLRPRRLVAGRMFVDRRSMPSLLLISVVVFASLKAWVGLVSLDCRNDMDPHLRLVRVASILSLRPFRAIL